MSDDKFQDKYRIDSARAWWHDYDGGTYFITICTKNREHFFGEIEDEKMVLSEIGEYTVEQFQNVSTHYPYTTIPLFTIMPNHVHAIVFIGDSKVSPCRDGVHIVSLSVFVYDETVYTPSLQRKNAKSLPYSKKLLYLRQ